MVSLDKEGKFKLWSIKRKYRIIASEHPGENKQCAGCCLLAPESFHALFL
jgi:hypothetical protein